MQVVLHIFMFLCINIQLLLILFCVLGQVLGQFFFNKQTFPLLSISIRLINPYKHFQELLNCALQTLSLRVPLFFKLVLHLILLLSFFRCLYLSTVFLFLHYIVLIWYCQLFCDRFFRTAFSF